MRPVTSAVHKAMGLAALAVLAGGASSVSAADDAEGLAEVVVTAQFREQNVQDVPLAITAISAEMLESRNQTNLTELTNQAPNVTLKQQGASYGPSLGASIRGIGQFDFNPAVEPGVGLYVDDVYFATLTGSVLDLLDLERVEILRGPQGTLAGRNSIGGAVKLYSQKPKGDDTGSIQATYGSRSRIDLRGSFDVGITDTLFARVSGVSKQQDGYIARVDYGCANPGNPYGIPSKRGLAAGCVVDYDSNVNFSAVRAALRWIASDNLEFNLSADYTDDTRNPVGTVLVAANTALSENIQPVTDTSPANNAPRAAFVPPAGSYYNYAGFYSPAGTYTGTVVQNYPLVESTADPRQFFQGWGAALNIDWKLSDSLALQSISAYRTYDSGFSNDNDLAPLAESLGNGTLPFRSFSQEVRLNGEFGDGTFNYTLGAFYMDQTSRYESWQDIRYLPTNPLQFEQNDTVNSDSQAVFGQLGWDLTEAMTLTAGIRYTEEHKDLTFVRIDRAGNANPFLAPLNGLKPPAYEGDNVDYRLAGQYRFSDALMAYVQYATGFKGGGTSPRPFVPAQARPFNPETLDTYEAGVKTDLFDRKLRVNASVFYGEYTDLQLGLLTCPQFGGPGPCGVIANAGDAEMKGVELETTWRPVAGLAIDGSVSYLDFSYTSLNPDVGGPARPTGIQDYMRPAYMPEWKASVGIQYTINLGNAGSITPRVDTSYLASQYASSNNRATNFIDEYTLVNARITWADGEDRWEASLEGTNLGSKYYFLSRNDQFASVGHTDGQPGRPREWAVTLKRKF